MASDVKLLGGQRQLFPKHLFLVDIGNGMWQGFQKCSELSYEIAKIEYWEGGSIIPWKVPGRVTMSDLTLERGACTSQEFYKWALESANASAGKAPTRGNGLNTPGYIDNLRIKQLDRDGQSVLRAWDVFNAWVQKFVAGDWDNTADEVVIEQLVLTYDWFELVAA